MQDRISVDFMLISQGTSMNVKSDLKIQGGDKHMAKLKSVEIRRTVNSF